MRSKYPEITDDDLIEQALRARMFYWRELANAMAQKHFKGPHGEVAGPDDIEHAFRMAERIELLLGERRRERYPNVTEDHYRGIGEIARDRMKRIVKEKEHYLEAFIAETGLKPSECALVIQHSGVDGIIASYHATKREDN